MTLLCLFLSVNANAFCQQITPYVSVNAQSGYVRYITHLSRDAFLRKSPVKMSPNTLGMTVSRLGISGSAEPEIQQNGITACIQISRMKIDIGYETLDVYIDKKYKPGTCEYEVVKEHENYHVRVSQEAMSFFKPDIEDALKKAVARVKPVEVRSQKEAERVFQNQFNQVMREVQPLIDHINKKIAEKNYEIDTPESYRETTMLCKNW